MNGMMEQMMDGMWTWMMIGWGLGALVLLAIVAAGVYLGVRAARGLGDRDALGPEDAARGLLDRRLAAGEIGTEEYYERESALRGART